MRLQRLQSLAVSTTVLTGLVLAGTTTAASADPGRATIGPGPSSNTGGVLCVQNALDVYPDGEFGQEVYDAVRRFQARNGLSVDGAVGRATGQKIYDLPQTPVACWSYLPTLR